MYTDDVLTLLKETEVVSGEEAEDALGIPRHDVWRHIELLREDGFVVEYMDGEYRLSEVPEYGEYAVRHHLDDGSSDRVIDFRTEVSSTNDVAVEAARHGAPEGTVVVARRQSSGRGRLDRTWVSPEGGVYMSMVLRPELSPGKDDTVLMLASAVAAARALNALGVEPTVKWPNDIHVGGRKITGILTETGVSDTGVSQSRVSEGGSNSSKTYAVLGFGVNYHGIPEIDNPRKSPTSVADQLKGDELDRAEFVTVLLRELDDVVCMEKEEIFEEWRSWSDTLGKRVRVFYDQEVHEGEAVGLDETGELQVDTEDGLEEIASGDCYHLRSASRNGE
ncbi:MAG: biotin--[acetyl-CoA-carboxylase] ligase [Halobacteria archaeon]